MIMWLLFALAKIYVSIFYGSPEATFYMGLSAYKLRLVHVYSFESEKLGEVPSRPEKRGDFL